MKKLISLFLALLFAFSTVTVVTAEGEPFRGVVIDETAETMTVINEFGTLLTFVPDTAVVMPAVGSTVSVEYAGDLATQLTAMAVTVEAEPAYVTVSAKVNTVTETNFTATLENGTEAEFRTNLLTLIGGVAGGLEEGQTVTVTYVDTVYGFVASSVLVTEGAVKTVEVVLDDTINKTLSGTVTKLTDSKITIKTKKGKSWTFKRVKKTQETGKYDLKVGCTVTITYDGYASKGPAAKKIKVTKAAPSKEYKTKSGTCEYFEGMMIGLTNGFEADVAYAKHSGKGNRGPGTKVKVTYYTKKGMNYAVKINWKTK